VEISRRSTPPPVISVHWPATVDCLHDRRREGGAGGPDTLQDHGRSRPCGASPVHPARAEITAIPDEIPSQAREGIDQARGGAPGRLLKTVQRYLSGASSKPRKRLQEALAQETESEWQPQIRAQARQRAVTSRGLVISCRASFGFGPDGTSDEEQVRDISVAVSRSHAAAILAERERGATDSDLHELVAEAIAEVYFRKCSPAHARLEVNFKDVEWLDISF
jgi:hypothetical protein